MTIAAVFFRYNNNVLAIELQCDGCIKLACDAIRSMVPWANGDSKSIAVWPSEQVELIIWTKQYAENELG